jgi:16S rRNA G966 N2-methylase RsmD
MDNLHYTPTQWMIFYKKIKDPSWPDCYNEHQFYSLPDWIKHEIVTQHSYGNLLVFDNSDIVDFTDYDPFENTSGNYNSTDIPECKLTYPVGENFFVYYDQHMDGGGTDFGQDYPRVISYLYPDKKFNHCLEWCAGAGHIGFRMLADGKCSQLTLLDAYQPALLACKKTIDHMPVQFKNTVTLQHCSNIEQLSEEYQFDLIIANPPHYSSKLLARNYFKYSQDQQVSVQDAVRIGIDEHWQMRKNFYGNIAKNLTKDGVIVLQENLQLSQPEDFREFIDQGGLKIVRSFATSSQPMIWYIVVTHK